MTIASLRIANFRNLAAVDIDPCHRGLNIICGNNGSGKTSLLEAIHYLGLGRSFRSSSSGRLIQHNTDKFSLFSQLVSDNLATTPVGLEREINGSTRLRMAEKDVASMTELARLLPLRVINSQSHQIFESGPTFRRKFLDWGLFYQSEPFLPCWRHFERAMKQRNAVLRARQSKQEVQIWSSELVKHGLQLNELRLAYVVLLAPIINDVVHELLNIDPLEITYQPGWDESTDYASVLNDAYWEEIRLGHTQYGPHRADLEITIDGIPVKHFLSRGQQKLLVCAMIIAQGMLLAKYVNKQLIYLVDDLPAELDLVSRQKLISLLAKQHSQVFITAIESEEICGFILNELEVQMKVFHVEHGNVTPQTVRAMVV
jgi:DNA replication and repair protein RecF